MLGWIIGSILSGVMFIVGVITTISDYKVLGKINLSNIFATITMFVLSIVFFKKYRDYKNGVTLRKKQEGAKKKEETNEKLKMVPGSKERIEELGANLCIAAKHMVGLPLAEDALSFIYLCNDKIIFERNETTYNLLLEKIKDITIKTDAEIQNVYVSSAGGAVGGALLFGPLGAMVGGRTKKKQNKTINNYLIFTYDKNDKVDFISFDVTGTFKAYKFVEFFNKVPKEKKIIDL